MNTFLPYIDFSKVARILDDKRLFKQAIEARQIIDILETGKTHSGKDYPLSMKHHPIVKAWAGFTPTLKYYFNCMVWEIDFRDKWNTEITSYSISDLETVLPPWITPQVCEMYQAHLFRKDSLHYQFFDVDPAIPFNWDLIKTDLSVTPPKDSSPA